MQFYVTGRISDNIRLTPEGYLLCLNVPIARTGEQEYGPDETPIEAKDEGSMVKIQRDEKEVFRAETIASFQGKPVTIGHPEDMVDPDSWRDLAKGTIQNVRRGEGEFNDSLIADLLITDKEAIKAIQKGLREVSCGYKADYVETGIGAGKQVNIVGNHLALVTQARAGSDYEIKDHKGANMGLKEIIAKAFPKGQDEVVKAVQAATKDAKTDGVGTEVMSDEAPAWAKDLSSSMGKIADALGKLNVGGNSEPTTSDDKEDKVADDDPMKKIMDALDAFGSRLDKLESKGANDEEEEETDDEDMDDEDFGDEDAEDEEEKESVVGDEKPRSEILAPGKKFSGKDAKAKCLEHAYGTKDGKEVIEILTGGKKPDLKNKKVVDTLFVKASDVLKIKRGRSFPGSHARVKVRDGHLENTSEAPSIEDINKKNQEFYEKQNQQRSH